MDGDKRGQSPETAPAEKDSPAPPIVPAIRSEKTAAGVGRDDPTAEETTPDLNRQIGTTDSAEATDTGEPFFPPTDPVIRVAPRERGGFEVVGGFAHTADDAPIETDPDVEPVEPGDAEVARLVRLALMEDAATADLRVRVLVRGGVVRLRGAVRSLDDAELAEAVAADVPGVVEVVDETTVSGL